MFDKTTDKGLVPLLAHCLFEGTFACFTCALLIGAVADRARLAPAVVFVFLWSTLVYDPVACWIWNPAGWANRMGYLDYAGGTPVHASAGFATLAYCYVLGPRTAPTSDDEQPRPYSIFFVVIGTFLMWSGWFGFNTGTSLAPSSRAVQALLNTQIAASVGGLAWAIMDYRIGSKWSIVGFCSGVVSGLVTITPGAGYVPAWTAVIAGILGACLANVATKLKFYLRVDDAFDVFAVHGVCGIIGNILTGIFAKKSIAGLDGITEIKGGWLDRHYVQLAYQLAGTFTAAGYVFVVTALLLLVIDRIPGLKIRISVEDEETGIDFAEHDEYAFDYVELFPELPANASDIFEHFQGTGHHETVEEGVNPEIEEEHELEAFKRDGSFKEMFRNLDSDFAANMGKEEAIEGMSTYRRIQGQLEMSRQQEEEQLQRQNGGALLDRSNTSSTINRENE